MRKNRKRYVSLFTKSVIVLIFIGILPLVIMGMSVYSTYQTFLQKMILDNMHRRTLAIGRDIQDLMEDMEKGTKILYTYQDMDLGYLYEILEEPGIGKNKKRIFVEDALKDILYLNQNIEQVFFVCPDGGLYSAVRSQEAMINGEKIWEWHNKQSSDEGRGVELLSEHTDEYCYGPLHQVFTIRRNIMNTKTIQSSDEEILGTLYIDINCEYLDRIVNGTMLEKDNQVYVVDKQSGRIIYASGDMDDHSGQDSVVCSLPSEYQYIKASGKYYIYSEVPKKEWMVIERVSVADLENRYQKIQVITLMLILFSMSLLVVIYLIYSKMSNQPIRKLKEAMKDIQNGQLDTRVDISSNDEIKILADGLNDMAEQLQSHIEKIYVAELRQKETEIKALKAQIEPHYLYNTLDVIRMTALINGDTESADMMEGLSQQMKYLLGGIKDMVPLRSEIDNIQNYFKIVSVRYENKYLLEIDMPDEMLDYKVPQLILQPVVENAVKHGLRPRHSDGVVAVRGKTDQEKIEITVMDNGVGMSPEELFKVRKLLEDDQNTEEISEETQYNIGLKNVSDRIKLIYGGEYGLEISSIEDTGTIVKYRLPVKEKESAGDREDV